MFHAEKHWEYLWGTGDHLVDGNAANFYGLNINFHLGKWMKYLGEIVSRMKHLRDYIPGFSNHQTFTLYGMLLFRRFLRKLCAFLRHKASGGCKKRKVRVYFALAFIIINLWESTNFNI